MLARDLRYVGDQHAGADGSIPEVTRWIEGRTSFDALERTSAVRRLAIDRFNESAIKPGEPMYLLNMRFTHVYLHHRYSLEAIYKNIGGMDFRYAMRGDGQTPTTIVPAAAQRRALTLALDALEPAALAVPDRVQAMIPPMPPGGDPQFVWAGSAGGTAFDEISLAGGLATEVIEGLMERERLGRVVLFRARSAENPSLDEILQGIVDRTWGAAPSPTATCSRSAASSSAWCSTRCSIAPGDRQALPDVRQVSELHLEKLDTRIAGMTGGSPADQALRAAARREIARYFAGDDDPATRSRHPVICRCRGRVEAGGAAGGSRRGRRLKVAVCRLPSAVSKITSSLRPMRERPFAP